MNKTTTTIEITDSDIKLFQAKKIQGKSILTFCAVKPISGCSDEDIAIILKNMILSLPVVCEDPILLLPRRSVILRQMILPSRNHREIEDMIGLKLLNNIPYSVEDVIYQYHLLGQEGEDYSRVLVIIVPKDVSHRYCRILKDGGIKHGKLTLSSLGILGFLAYQEKVCQCVNNQPVIVLNICEKHTEVCFCHNQKLFYSRNISYGGEYLRSSDAIELVKQIKLSLETYQKECLKLEIQKILILSTADDGKMMGKQLEKEIGIPVENTDPFNGILCSPNMDQTALHACRPSSIIADLGFLLSNTKNLINLAPREIHLEKQIRIQRRQFVKFGLLLCIAVFLSVSSRFVDIHKKKTYLESLKSEVVRLQPQLKEARRKRGLVESFNQKFEQYSFVPDLVNELNRLTPETVFFKTLSLNREKHLIIQGYTQDQVSINDLQAHLIQSNWFYDVDLKFATKRTIANMPVMDFKIAVQLADHKGGVL